MFRYSLWSRVRSLKPIAPPTVVRSSSRGLALQSSSSSSPSPEKYARNGAARSSPSQHLSRAEQIRTLNKAGIGLPSELTRLQLPPGGPRTFTARIAPRHCIRQMELQWLIDDGHPRGLLITERCFYHTKSRPLWKATLVQGGQAIVRGKAKACATVAFRQALGNMGYDAQGRKVDPTKPSYPERVGDNRDAWRKTIAELYGTVHFHSNDALQILNQPFSDLRSFMEKIVRSLEETLGRTAAGEKANVSGRESSSGKQGDRKHGDRRYGDRGNRYRAPGTSGTQTQFRKTKT